MKPYIGQAICNDQGRIMGSIVRIVHSASGDTLFYVPLFTPVYFGDAKFYRSEDGKKLDG
ncbi:hypothetical protein HWB51_gp111 [Mycobacterium phage Cuke]|uniref:PRC-barrel domain-containing protein n=1 Tax=Mycobacterium phage Cuke TaxID=2079417 RepID=A0A2L1IWY8_9CAUD|nr:hypothetical protein HWB51_gp111 [Mycobacterium phage Cuke]AVD99701.1 hypothetical protein SEA_CUKE_85 [Mycobacterium phage Cuke]